MSQMLDLDTPPRLERLLAQTHAGQETLRAELDRERAWLDDFACRAGLRRELVRRFVAVGLLAESPGEATAVPGALRAQTECVTIGLLLDVLHRLDALRDQAGPAQVALWT
jgi:hypothetical protein